MKVEVLVTSPRGDETDRFTYETNRGLVVALVTRPGATCVEREAAARGLSDALQQDDIALVLPHGYDLKVFQVPADA